MIGMIVPAARIGGNTNVSFEVDVPPQCEHRARQRLNPHLTPVEVGDECFDAGVDVVVLAGQRGRQAHRACSVGPEIRGPGVDLHDVLRLVCVLRTAIIIPTPIQPTDSSFYNNGLWKVWATAGGHGRGPGTAVPWYPDKSRVVTAVACLHTVLVVTLCLSDSH
jgi:hypothetical protein